LSERLRNETLSACGLRQSHSLPEPVGSGIVTAMRGALVILVAFNTLGAERWTLERPMTRMHDLPDRSRWTFRSFWVTQ
jgi:hypothetical protein